MLTPRLTTYYQVFKWVSADKDLETKYRIYNRDVEIVLGNKVPISAFLTYQERLTCV